jgi:hypothetical protein
MKLLAILMQLSVQDLKTIVAATGLRLPYYYLYKQDIGEQIARHLTDPSVLDGIVSRLDQPARAALDALIAQDGRMMARLFCGEYGTFGENSAGYNARQDRFGKPNNAAQVLADCGLIYQGYMDVGAWRGEGVFIPADLLALLPKVATPPFARVLAATPPPAYVSAHTDLARDVGMFLCMCQRDAVRAVYGDRLSKRDVLKMNEDMSLRQDLSAMRAESDAAWIEFVHHAAAMLGLIVVEGTLIVPSHKGEEFLRQSHDKQVHELWNAFLKDGGWSDVAKCLVPSLVYIQPDAGYNVAIRGRVVAALKQCPPGTWLAVESFDKAMRAHDPTFLRSRTSSKSDWQPWLRTSEFLGGWDVIETPLLKYIIGGPLLWMGVVEVGANSSNVEPTVFRLTEQGAILLGIKHGKLATIEAAAVVIQANFDVVVPRETPPGELYLLQQVAALAKRDQASIYRLDQLSIWRCLQAGRDIEHIIDFLERISHRELPQNVAYSLREWAQKYGEISIERATMLQTTSDALLVELRANKKLALPVGNSLSPRAVTLNQPDVAALVIALQKAGYWPKTTRPLETDGAPGHASTIEIKTADLVMLLAAAMAFQTVGTQFGWTTLSENLLQRALGRLSPQAVQHVQRLARETAAQAISALTEPDEDL